MVALLIANGLALAEEAPAAQPAAENNASQSAPEATENVKKWYEYLPAESKIRQAAEKKFEAHKPRLRDLELAFTCLTRPYLKNLVLDDYCNCSHNKYLQDETASFMQ